MFHRKGTGNGLGLPLEELTQLTISIAQVHSTRYLRKMLGIN